MSKKSDDVVYELLKTYYDNGFSIMVDSGAHTFFEQAGIALGGLDKVKLMKFQETYDKEAARLYVTKYFDWIQKYQGLFPNIYFVELDIQALVGTAMVAEWRAEAIARGLTIIPVWHNLADEMEDWDKLCSQYKYVGIEGGKEVGQYVPFLNIAAKYKTKVQAFAMTKPDHMRKLPFFSVDSTSWLSGSRFGQVSVFRGGSISMVGKDQRMIVNTIADQIGLKREELNEWKGYVLDLLSAYAWTQYSDYIDAISKKYWEGEEQEAMSTGGRPVGAEGLEIPIGKEHNKTEDGTKVNLEGTKDTPQNPNEQPKGQEAGLALSPLRGKIREYLDTHPEAEAARRAGLRAISLQNKIAHNESWYTEYGEATELTKAWVNFVADADLSDPIVKAQFAEEFLRQQITTIGMGGYFEAKDGWVPDKNLLTHRRELINTLLGTGNAPAVQNNLQINLNGLNNEQLNAIDKLVTSLGVLTRPDKGEAGSEEPVEGSVEPTDPRPDTQPISPEPSQAESQQPAQSGEVVGAEVVSGEPREGGDIPAPTDTNT